MKYRRKMPHVEAISFSELVAHGRSQGVPCYNGMPWSFTWAGFPVTHENDMLYLVGNLQLPSGCTAIVTDGELSILDSQVFAILYEEAPESPAGTEEARRALEAALAPTWPTESEIQSRRENDMDEVDGKPW